jgi:hypothetical protein
MYYKFNSDERSRYQCCRGKAISITYSEYVSVALVIQHAKRMRRVIVLCCLTGSTIFHDLINGTIFEKKFFEHKMCVLMFPTTSV